MAHRPRAGMHSINRHPGKEVWVGERPRAGPGASWESQGRGPAALRPESTSAAGAYELNLNLAVTRSWQARLLGWQASSFPPSLSGVPSGVSGILPLSFTFDIFPDHLCLIYLHPDPCSHLSLYL